MLPESSAGETETALKAAAEKVRLFRVMREEMLALRDCLERLAAPLAAKKEHFVPNPSDVDPLSASPPEASPADAEGDALSRLPVHLARIDEIQRQIDELDRRAQTNSAGEISAAIPAILREIEEIHRDSLHLAEKARGRLTDALRDLRAARRATAYLKHRPNSSGPVPGGWFVDRRR